MARYLYSELSKLIQARAKCLKTLDRGTRATCYHKERPPLGPCKTCVDWAEVHTERVDTLIADHMPSGGGFDAGTHLWWSASHADKLVFTTQYHHMTEGFYCGWTEHTVIVTPALSGHFHLRVTGRDRNQIKEHIAECFRAALTQEVL